MESNSKSLHPMLWVAAASVTIASLAAAAHFAGLLPGKGGAEAPAPLVASAPPAAPPEAPAAAAPAPLPAPTPAPEAAKPAAKPASAHRAGEPVRATRPAVHGEARKEGGTQRVSTNDAGIDVIPAGPAPAAGSPQTVPEMAPPVCRECGTVESIREVETKGQGSGLGAVAGGVLGGVLGHQVGRGTGKDLATIAGAVGGAFAGHQVERNVRTDKQYQVTVRFDDGSVRSYTLANPGWQTGARVRLSNGSLVPL